MSHGVGDVLGRHHRLRHAGEAGELVDHAFDVVDLTDDRVGALLENAAVLGDHAPVLPPQAFGGELDGSERVFDLVRDATCDVGPRRGALRGHEFGDVVERHHIAALGGARLLARDPHREIALSAVAVDRHLALNQALHPGAGSLKHAGKLGDDLSQGLSEHLGLRASDELLRRSIQDADAAVGIDADDAGARASQNGLGEATAAVNQVTGTDDVVALGAQLLGHLVESLAQLGEVPLGAPRRHLDVKIAGRDNLSRADQAPDRCHEVIGKVQSDPDRGQQHDERNHRVHQSERDLNADPARGEIGILSDARLRRP